MSVETPKDIFEAAVADELDDEDDDDEEDDEELELNEFEPFKRCFLLELSLVLKEDGLLCFLFVFSKLNVLLLSFCPISMGDVIEGGDAE